jgi:hypothetical protein
MASLIGPGLRTLEELLASPGTTGSIARSVAGALAGFTVVDIVNHFLAHPSSKSAHPGTRYAIVDLHGNTIITFISRKRLYRLLSRPKSFRNRRAQKIVVVSADSSQGSVQSLR